MDKWTFSRACELRDLQISPQCQHSDDQIGSPHPEIVSWPNYTQHVVSSLHRLPFLQSKALRYHRAKAPSADAFASPGSATAVAETIISIATLNSAHGCTYKWAYALFEISLLLFVFVFLLKRRCGGLFSVLDYFSILQGLYGYDIKYSQDHHAKMLWVGETLGRLLPKQTQLAECWRQLAD